MSFSFEFNYEIDGRKVSKEEWMRHLEREATTKAMPCVAEDIKTRVSRLRCPVHNESPKVARINIEGNRLTTSIEACCDEMLKRAEQVAAGQ